MAKMTSDALQALTASLTASADEKSPFFKEGGATYMRYDEVRIRMAGKSMLEVEFYWRGMHTHTMNIECDLMAGQLAIVTGIEGRTGLRATL